MTLDTQLAEIQKRAEEADQAWYYASEHSCHILTKHEIPRLLRVIAKLREQRDGYTRNTAATNQSAKLERERHDAELLTELTRKDT